jgi:hypothetical protein
VCVCVCVCVCTRVCTHTVYTPVHTHTFANTLLYSHAHKLTHAHTLLPPLLFPLSAVLRHALFSQQHCLLTHLAEEVDPCSSSSWVVVGGKKQWHCPICRKKCCCSVTNCTATHRHCKAYRYRRRRAELASKRLNPGAASARGETPSLTLCSGALPDATTPGEGKEATEAAATNNAGVASSVASTKRPRKSPSTSRAKAKAIGYALLSSTFDPDTPAARGGAQREQSEAEAGGKLRGEQDAEEHDVLSLHDCAGYVRV